MVGISKIPGFSVSCGNSAVKSASACLARLGCLDVLTGLRFEAVAFFFFLAEFRPSGLATFGSGLTSVGSAEALVFFLPVLVFGTFSPASFFFSSYIYTVKPPFIRYSAEIPPNP
jgi:hypothetical protein